MDGLHSRVEIHTHTHNCKRVFLIPAWWHVSSAVYRTSPRAVETRARRGPRPGGGEEGCVCSDLDASLFFSLCLFFICCQDKTKVDTGEALTLCSETSRRDSPVIPTRSFLPVSQRNGSWSKSKSPKAYWLNAKSRHGLLHTPNAVKLNPIRFKRRQKMSKHKEMNITFLLFF